MTSIIQYDFENRLPDLVGGFHLYGLRKFYKDAIILIYICNGGAIDGLRDKYKNGSPEKLA